MAFNSDDVDSKYGLGSSPAPGDASTSTPTNGFNSDDVDKKFAGVQIPPSPAETGSAYIQAGGQKTWGDTGQTLKAGAYDAAAPLAQLWSPAAGAAMRKGSAEAEAQETPAGQVASQEGGITNPSFWEKQAGGVAAMAAPIAATAALGAPAAVVAGVGAGLGALMNTGGYKSSVAGAVENASTDDLMQDPQFKADIGKGMPEADARAALAQRNTTYGGEALSGVIGAVQGGLGGAELGGAASGIIDDTLGAALTGSINKTATTLTGGAGTLGKVVRGAGRGYAEQVVPGTAQAGVTQQSEANASAGPQPTVGSALAEGASQGPMGIVMGGVGSFAHAKPGENATGNRVLSSPAKDLKPDAKTTVTPTDTSIASNVVPNQTAPGRAPPDPVGDPAIATALGKPPVTPESNVTQQSKPPVEPVISPDTISTTAPQPIGAPPAGDTTSPLPIPQKVGEASPAPVSVNPPQGSGEVVAPEPQSDLQAQHAALMDPKNPREAMLYGPGEAVIPPTAKKGRFDTTTLQDGRQLQYDRQGASKLNRAKVADLDSQGKLNDLLQMGPVDKNEAIQRSVAGEPPVVVSERTPDGAQAKSAVGTTTTAPEQARVFEATKDPNNTVQVENPEQNIGDQLKQAQAEKAPPADPVTLQSNPGVDGAPATLAPLDKGAALRAQIAARRAALDAEAAERFKPRSIDPSQYVAESARPVQLAGDRIDPETQRMIDQRPPQGRVLADTSPEEQARAEAQRTADAENAKRVATEKPVAGPKEKSDLKERRLGADKKQALIDTNAIGDAAVDRHPPSERDALALDPNQPGGKGSRNELLDRVRSMTKDAQDSGYKLMRPLRDRVGETNHTSKNVLLHEADLLGRKKVAKTSDFMRYLDAEHKLLHGGEEGRADVMRMRSETGRESAVERGQATKEGGVEDIENVKGAEPAERHDVADEFEKAKENVAEDKVAQEPGEQRQLTENERRAQEASERAKARLAEEGAPRERVTPKSNDNDEPAVRGFGNAVGFKVAGKGERTRLNIGERPKINVGETLKLKRQPMDDDARESGPRTVEVAGKSVEVQHSTTAKDALSDEYDPKKFSPAEQAIHKPLIDAVNRIAGDVPVHYISDAEMTRINDGEKTHGLYVADADGTDHIFLNADNMRPDTALHEVFHAATLRALDDDPHLSGLLDRLRDEMATEVSNRIRANEKGLPYGQLEYAFSDRHEFLTALMTNPNIQKVLKGTRISDELAKDIGIPKWRKATMWNGVLHTIQRALGLEPRHVSAIEAAMAITEHTLWKQSPGMEAEGVGRFARSQFKFQRAIADEPPEEQAKAMGGQAQEANSKIADILQSDLVKSTASGVADKTYGAYSKVAGTDTLRINSEHLYGAKDENNPFRRAQEGLEKQGQKIRDFLSKGNPLLNRMADLKRAAPERLNAIVKLLSESADYNVHPDHELGEGLNDHIKPDPKTKEFGVNSNRDSHEGILAYNRLAGDFDKLNEPDKALFQDLRDTMTKEGQANSAAHLKNLSDGIRQNFENDEKLQAAIAKPEGDRAPSEVKKVERYEALSKVLDGKKLDGDEAERFGDDPQAKMLKNARAMLDKDGPYFPTTRKGDWVVNGEHAIPEAEKAIEQEGNTATFANEQDAYDYRKTLVDQSLPSHLETIRDPTSTEQGRGNTDTYKVTVQNKHSSAYDSRYEAGKASDALKAAGLKNVTEPMVREKNESLDYGLHNGAMQAMDHAVDALTHLSNEQKADLKEANRQASLGLARGNRANMGLLARNRVRGANADPILAVHDYLSATARNRARVETQPDIDRAMNEMRKTTRNVQDGETWKRGILTKEMETRASNFGVGGATGQMNPLLQNLSTLAFVKYMAAPVHFALDLTHPYLTSIPQLAARHGFTTAHIAYQKTLGDMGGRTPALAKGMVGAWKAAWDRGHQPTDFLSGIKDTLKKNGATADELRAIDQATETGALHSILMDFERHYDKTGKFQSGMDRVQSIGQEMSSAVDAINRVATFLTGYRLERAKMGEALTPESNAAHHAQAIRYAKDTLTQTQGLHTTSNRGSALRNPIVRAAMQFRSVPMMLYKIMGRNIYDAFKGETPEVKWGAVKALLATMGTTAALAGGPAAVPEPIRLAVMLAHMLGLGPSWEGLEDQARRAADAHWGKYGGRIAMDGILGAAGLSAGSRIGQNDLFIKGDPTTGSAKDFLFDTVVGAPGGYLNDQISGPNQILHGDYRHGIPNSIPIRALSDITKAMMGGQEGTPAKGSTPGMAPLDPYEMFVQAMGGTPTRQALHTKESNLIRAESGDRKAAIQSAVGGDRSKMIAWNQSHPQDRINQSHILRAKQTNKIETPRQRATEERYSAYQ